MAFELNHDATIVSCTHKRRKSDDTVKKIFLQMKVENVGAGPVAQLLGIEDPAPVESGFFDEKGDKLFLAIAGVNIDKKLMVFEGVHFVVLGRFAKQRVHKLSTFIVNPRGDKRFDVDFKLTFEDPPAGLYESLCDFEGRPIKCRLEQQAELNLKPKAAQDTLDLQAKKDAKAEKRTPKEKKRDKEQLQKAADALAAGSAA